MKNYTDIEQSRKLAEILPSESADMTYTPIMDIDSMSNSGFLNIPECYPFNEFKNSIIKPLPCWSLTALLGVLPNGIVINKDVENGKYHFSSIHIGTYVTAENPIDACVELIIRLNELKLI